MRQKIITLQKTLKQAVKTVKKALKNIIKQIQKILRKKAKQIHKFIKNKNKQILKILKNKKKQFLNFIKAEKKKLDKKCKVLLQKFQKKCKKVRITLVSKLNKSASRLQNFAGAFKQRFMLLIRRTKESIQKFVKTRTVDFILFASAVLILTLGIIQTPWKKFSTKETLTVLVITQLHEDAIDNELLEEIIQEFEQDRVNIRVKLESGADAAGDIIIYDRLWEAELYADGIIDISSELQEPLVSFFHPLFYNIKLLTDAGFSRPPQNRREFLLQAEAVTDPESGRYGIAFALDENNPHDVYKDIYPWIWSSGASIYDNNRQFTDSLEFLVQLNSAVHPDSVFMTPDKKREAFINNRVAFITSPVQDISVLYQTMGEDAFGISLIPGPETFLSRSVFGVTDINVSINKNSNFMDEAADFVSFLVGKKQKLTETSQFIPGSGNVSAEILSDQLYAKAWELYIAADLVWEYPAIDETGDSPQTAADREAIFRRELLRRWDF